MTDAEALATVRQYGAAGRFYLTPHARERAAERGVRIADVRHGLANAAACKLQERGTWRVDAADRDGEPLAMAVAIEASVIVVTVF